MYLFVGNALGYFLFREMGSGGEGGGGGKRTILISFEQVMQDTCSP